jgi:protein HIRA/HIR1
MLVDKPPWVAHDRTCAEIYGVDVCPDAGRFATAGGDHKVKIWVLAPVVSAAAEASSSAPRLLATLADHFGPVNAVRFSSSGRRLATGSDDKLVLVHEPRAVFGAADPPALENWQARAAGPGAARRARAWLTRCVLRRTR